MSIKQTRTVRELAVEVPNATRVFEKLGIDYCCGGTKPLAEACGAAGLQVDEVIRELEASSQATNGGERDVAAGSLSELIGHIVRTHHKFTREEIARLKALLDKVCAAHGKNHAELGTIRETFLGLAQELTLHLMKEENVLFPYIVRMEEGQLKNSPVPTPPFGTVQNPVGMMMHEHDGAGEALRRIRALSRDFSVPGDACVSYRTLYEGLAGFEADLHQHIHLENNILFPRSIEMEDSSVVTANFRS